MMRKTALALCAAALLTGANAAENEFKTHTELSYIDTQGNTETTSFSVESKGEKTWDAHAFRALFNAYYSEDNGVTSKNKWQTELNYDYTFTPHFAFNYLFGFVSDRFSGYDNQLYTGPGIVYKVLTGTTHQLNTYVNVLYAQDDVADSIDPVTSATVYGKIERYGSWKAGFDYGWQILENLRFGEEASIRSSFREAENYFATSKTSLTNKINGNFSMGLSYKVDYVNQPPVGREYTDRTFLASLIIDY